MRAERTRWAALPAFLVLGLVAGCGGTDGITAPRLENSFAVTFGRLYVLQQVRQGQLSPDPAALQASASCQRGSQSTRQSGAGNDWSCQVTYLVAGPGTPVRALYNLTVHTDGCWAADGDGPTSVNGARTLTGPSGQARVNPLYLVDGCFDGG